LRLHAAEAGGVSMRLSSCVVEKLRLRAAKAGGVLPVLIYFLLFVFGAGVLAFFGCVGPLKVFRARATNFCRIGDS
jgi:hypothetical protein